MPFVYFLLTIAFLNIVYTLGFLYAALISAVRHQHYFLGYNPSLFNVTISGVKFTMGVYIPIIGLARIYRIESGIKKVAYYPWQFQSQPIWKRLFVTYSGVLSLIVFSLITFIIINAVREETYISKEEVNKFGIYPSVLAQSFGFKSGDKIIAVNGKDYENFYELVNDDVIHSSESYYTILREGTEMTIKLIGPDPAPSQSGELFLELLAPFEVGEVKPGSPAEEAGLQPGDKILKVNGNPIVKYRDMNDRFEKDDDGEVLLQIQRTSGTSTKTFEKTIALDYNKRIGIYVKELITYTTRHNTFAQALVKGITQTFKSIVIQTKAFATVITGKVYSVERSMRGPIGIMSAFGDSFDWIRFWSFTALYATFVVSLNFLPLPKSALWEVIPLAYEKLMRKPFSFKRFSRLKSAGTFILIFFFLWVFVNDIIKLF